MSSTFDMLVHALRPLDAIQSLKYEQPKGVEYDAFCQRCGSRASVMLRLEDDPPTDGFFRITCPRCAGGEL